MLPSLSPSLSMALVVVVLVEAVEARVLAVGAALVPPVTSPLCMFSSRACSSEANCWKAEEKSVLLALVELVVALLEAVLAVEVVKDVELAEDALEVEAVEPYQLTEADEPLMLLTMRELPLTYKIDARFRTIYSRKRAC